MTDSIYGLDQDCPTPTPNSGFEQSVPRMCCYFEGCGPEGWLVGAARGGTLKVLPPFLLFLCVMWTNCHPLLTPKHSSSAWSSLGRWTVTLWIQGSTNRSLSCFCQVVCDSQENYLTTDHWWGLIQPKVGNMPIINRLLWGVQRFIKQRQEGSAG